MISVVEFLMEESEDLAFTEVDCTAADSIDLCKQEDVQVGETTRNKTSVFLVVGPLRK